MTDRPTDPSTDRNPSAPDGPAVHNGDRPQPLSSVPDASAWTVRPVELDDVHVPDPSSTRQPSTVRDPLADDPELRKANRHAYGLINLYCLAVVGGSMDGQITGAVSHFHIPLAEAIFVVGSLELGGMVVFHFYDVRRRIGESALLLMGASFAIAGFAALANYLSHVGALAYVFPGMTALALFLYVAKTEARRRDAQRAKGHGKPILPTYELVGHYLLHPWLTLRAKSIAKRLIEGGGKIGRYESFEQARREAQTQRRNRVLEVRLGRKLGAASNLATAVFDPDAIAARMRSQADNAAVADAMMADLGIDVVAAAGPSGRSGRGKSSAPKASTTDGPSTDQPSTVHEPQPSADRPDGDRPQTPSVRRPSPRPSAAHDRTPSAGLHLVWSPTVRRNAAELRATYPNGLPINARTQQPSVRQVRDQMQWHNDKAAPAVKAYLDGADLDDQEDQQVMTG